MAFFDTLGGLVSTVGGIIDLFSDSESEDVAREGKFSLREARRAALASVDPNSPRFKNLEGILLEGMRRNAVQNIERVRSISQRARARGDAGFAVNPERRDEARFGALTKAFMLAREQARIDTHNLLSDAARAISGVAGAASPLSAAQSVDARNAAIFPAIGETISSLGQAFTFPTAQNAGFIGSLSQPSSNPISSTPFSFRNLLSTEL